MTRVDPERRERVLQLTTQIVDIVTSNRGITVDALHSMFPQDGHTFWDVAGALDIVTGYSDKASFSTIEIQRDAWGERHLVLRESPTEYVTRHHLDLREYLP